MSKISGIGKKSRIRLGKVIRHCKSNLITTEQVAHVLQITKLQARRLLQYWEKNGWLYRIRRGLYQPLSLEANSVKTVIEDPWIVANKLFSPCYIGGWSAVEFWDFTEQIFQTIIVVTSRRFSKKDFNIGETSYRLKMASKKVSFGLQTIWRDNVKVKISDPSKTIIDILNDPLLGGSMRPVIDFFKEYLRSDKKDLGKLIEYGDLINNRTIFKRLGFLLESLLPLESNFIDECKKRISKGRSQFDPSSKGKHYIKKWSLLLPESFCKLHMERLDD